MSRNQPTEPVLALRAHWPEYAMEALELALFMVSACIFTVLLEHPQSPARAAIDSATARRMLTGIAMGLTAVAIIYSPLGQRSGAHMNPAVTLAYWRLGKIRPWDAAFYIAAQFMGAAAGVLAMRLLIAGPVSDPAVSFAATVPGAPGAAGAVIAWIAEFAIALVLMFTILCVSNWRAAAPYTGVFAGALVATWITAEAPLSGTSMNPARSFASALFAGSLEPMWIYFTAPPLAMLAASSLYVRLVGLEHVFCAKLNHSGRARCIFRCRFDAMEIVRGGARLPAEPSPQPPTHGAPGRAVAGRVAPNRRCATPLSRETLHSG
jgi:aquaporin Z